MSRAGAAPRRRHGGRVALVFVLIGALLAAALIVGDEAARGYAEKQAAERIAAQLGLASPPQVHIAGRPFLTQAARQRFGDVTLDAADVPTSADGVRVATLHVDAHGVDTYSPTMIGSLDGTARVDWAQVSAASKRQVTFVDPNRVSLDFSPLVLGRELPVTVTGRPVLAGDGRTVSLADAQVRVTGFDLPAELADRLVTMAGAVPLDLPYGLRATSIAATADGAVLGFTGTDVRLG